MFRILVGVALLLAALGAVACDDAKEDSQQEADVDLEAQIEDLQTQLEGLKSRVDYHDVRIQHAEMLGALTTLHLEGLHELDEELQAASEAPAGSAARARRMLAAMQATTWPVEMQEQAHGLEDTLDELMDALEAGNLATAKERATAAHEAWHGLEEAAYTEIAGPQPDHEHNPDGSHTDEEEATPTG